MQSCLLVFLPCYVFNQGTQYAVEIWIIDGVKWSPLPPQLINTITQQHTVYAWNICIREKLRLFGPYIFGYICLELVVWEHNECDTHRATNRIAMLLLCPFLYSRIILLNKKQCVISPIHCNDATANECCKESSPFYSY